MPQSFQRRGSFGILTTECLQLGVVKYLLCMGGIQWGNSESHRESTLDWASVSTYNDQRWGYGLALSTSKAAFIMSWQIHRPQNRSPVALKHNSETVIILYCIYKNSKPSPNTVTTHDCWVSLILLNSCLSIINNDFWKRLCLRIKLNNVSLS